MKNNRRYFLKTTTALGAATVLSGTSFLSACKEKEGDEKEVSPPEDLMQEHGLLNRILLIYDHCKIMLVNKESFPVENLSHSAGIVRTFVEDYHEKQEENYLFPRFQKANQLTDLVDVLLRQHMAGRNITDRITSLAKQQSRSDNENRTLIDLLTSFNKMYRPHEAREDTVLFPAFRKLVSKHEYDSLGEEFENNEHKLFGEDGFEKMVDKVSEIEKQLGIFNLSDFTPAP
jgi:hemerythrin-like domain-containing protein